ncbi:hypothetical protein ERJ75_001112600 [Trypanosoma vivax]|nr:hypothetical protein ERJ75_001112600 [Trypanosoma vivax]
MKSWPGKRHDLALQPCWEQWQHRLRCRQYRRLRLRLQGDKAAVNRLARHEGEGQGANPTQIENNNWPITRESAKAEARRNETKRRGHQHAHDRRACNTARTLKPDKAATDNPTNTYCLGQAGNQGCDATSNQQEACVCYAKETAEQQAACPAGHPLQWRSPHACERPPNWKDRSTRSEKRPTRRRHRQAMAQHLETLRQSGATTSRDSKGKDTAPSHQASRNTGNTQSEDHTTRTETTGDQGSQTDSKRECDRTHPNWDENTKTCANTATARTAFWAAAACVAQLTAVRPSRETRMRACATET